MNKTIQQLRKLKETSEKFSVIAAYDASFAQAINQAGVDAILVGDSLGMVVQGKHSTIPVSVGDMIYHTTAVARACQQASNSALLISDMPFMSYQTTDIALKTAAALMQAGANMVKLEGGEWLTSTVRKLADCGIPVCAHLGLTPQSVNKLGGYKVQGKSDQQKSTLLQDSLALEQAGADFIVFECIPAPLAKQVTEQLNISSIGIGAGPHTDAQVLVSYDLLGLTGSQARFVQNFLTTENIQSENPISDAFAAFDRAVKNGSYPAEQHQYN